MSSGNDIDAHNDAQCRPRATLGGAFTAHYQSFPIRTCLVTLSKERENAPSMSSGDDIRNCLYGESQIVSLTNISKSSHVRENKMGQLS